MRKEILFAILAGSLFGLVIAFGIWRANSSMGNNVVENIKDQITENVNNTQGSFTVTIAKPESNQVLTSSPAIITGITKSNAWVVISGEESDSIIQAAADGSFESDMELIAGTNEIIVSAHDDSGDSAENRMVLVYSTEFD